MKHLSKNKCEKKFVNTHEVNKKKLNFLYTDVIYVYICN